MSGGTPFAEAQKSKAQPATADYGGFEDLFYLTDEEKEALRKKLEMITKARKLKEKGTQ